MTGLDAGLIRLYRAIDRLGFPIMVGGGVAAVVFGEPRTTLDIDIVIDVLPADADRIVAGIDPEQFYVPPLEAIRREIGRGGKGQFNIIDFSSGMKADLYPAGEDALIHYGLDHVQNRSLFGLTMQLAPATYVVAMKLRYYVIRCQDKHLRDIRAILAASPEEVDRREVDRWAAACSASAAWEACQAAPGAE